MTEAEMKTLVRKYVTQQLSWLPISVLTFYRRLRQVLEGFRSVFLGGAGADDGNGIVLPTVSEATMHETAQRKLLDTERVFRDNAVDALSSQNIPDYPDVAQMKTGAVVFIPTIVRADAQSEESYQEQFSALRSCISAIDSIIGERELNLNAIVLVGPPGCGKTHVLLIVYCYCLENDVPCTLTAITSERARKLGGQHLHFLFGIPVQQGRICTVHSWASSTLVYLARNPIRYAYLKRLKVILFEEFSLLSSEMLAVMDIVLRSIKGNDKFLGGVLFMATGDPCQLSPIDGTPVWASHHFISSFSIVNMINCVRARHDGDLQQIIDILRTMQPTVRQIQTFTDIMSRRCLPALCLPSWSDVPPDVLRIVGTKKACEEIVNDYIDHFRSQNRIAHTTCLAYDEAETGSGGWSRAAEWIQRTLSNQCLEQRSLFLHVGQVLRLTYNNKHGSAAVPQFSQGQCCVVQRLPTDAYQQLWVKLVPPGQRYFDPNDMPNEPGWEVFNLRPAPSHCCVVSAGQTKARRNQYRVTYFVCSTVHRALGDTLPRIATNISIREHRYRLWERQQLLVVLSRVASLDDILFITTDPTDTMLAMQKLLHQKLPPVQQLLDTLDVNANEPRIFPYSVDHLRIPLPAAECGYVYMLVSVPFRHFA